MKNFLKLLILFSFFSQDIFAQKAGIYKLEKLYNPQPSDGNFNTWKNEVILIPIRYESNSKQQVTVSLSGLESDVQLFQVHEVWADFSAGNCGETKTNGTFEKVKVPDRAELRPDMTFIPSGEGQWLILQVKSKSNITSGTFPFAVTFTAQGKKTEVKGTFSVRERLLKDPLPKDFYSDFWQFPVAMADYYQIKPWSEQHWKEVELMFEQLNQINQHSITTSVFWDLYNTRVRPLDEMMIQVKKSTTGSFSYDYGVFDRYVELAHAKGISGQIAVHNLFPWNGFFFYFDESTSTVQSVQTQPGTPEYQAFWKPFLLDFSNHLKAKGWQHKTVFFIDERDPNITLDLAKWVKSISPDVKMGFSGDFYPFISEWMEDYSMPMNVVVDPVEMKKRILSGKKTSLYTSCFEQPNQPNLLLISDYRETYFLTQLSKAKGYEGMLRWAFNLWSSEIMDSAIYSDLPSGDAHLIYPKGQVSVRYLVLKDALEELAKLEAVSRISNSADMMNAMNRYFLINIEADRYQMVQTMRNYLND
jgi:hypothetical protein